MTRTTRHEQTEAAGRVCKQFDLFTIGTENDPSAALLNKVDELDDEAADALIAKLLARKAASESNGDGDTPEPEKPAAKKKATTKKKK